MEKAIIKQEVEELKAWCTCAVCTGKIPWYQFLGACEDCFHVFDNPSRESINAARAYRASLHGKRPPRLPRWYVTQAITWICMVVVFMVVIGAELLATSFFSGLIVVLTCLVLFTMNVIN